MKEGASDYYKRLGTIRNNELQNASNVRCSEIVKLFLLST